MWRLFPRQPGYVITVCARTIDMEASKASAARSLYMVCVLFSLAFYVDSVVVLCDEEER